MKVTIEFEDPQQAEMALAAAEMHALMWEVDQKLRTFLKHGGNATQTAEDCRSLMADVVTRWS
jgi:hypothetical protein